MRNWFLVALESRKQCWMPRRVCVRLCVCGALYMCVRVQFRKKALRTRQVRQYRSLYQEISVDSRPGQDMCLLEGLDKLSAGNSLTHSRTVTYTFLILSSPPSSLSPGDALTSLSLFLVPSFLRDLSFFLGILPSSGLLLFIHSSPLLIITARDLMHSGPGKMAK